MDDQVSSKVKKSLLIGLAVGGIMGVIGTVLVMVLSRPIRPAAIEIRMPEPTAALPTEAPLPTETPGLLHVYVTGAVVAADVYELPPGSLVKDAIVMAGGFSAEANEAAVNLALSLRDEDHIHVPAVDEAAVIPPVSSGSDSSLGVAESGPAGGLVNINTASLEQLDTLPGIGPAIAQDIIDYREVNGPFETIEDIMKVSGIGPAKFEAIQELITVQ